MNTTKQPCPKYTWCSGGHDRQMPEDRSSHVGIIASLEAQNTSLNVGVAVDVFLNDVTGQTVFGAQLGDWDLESEHVVDRIRDLRMIADKLEALLTTWTPENAAVTL